MKQLMCAIMIATATGCNKAENRTHEVKMSNEPKGDITLNNIKFITILADGSWLWHRTPEETVTLISNYAIQMQQKAESCGREVRK